MRAWLLALCLFAQPAHACRLALALGFDISSSVNAAEDELQRQGIAWALEQPDVARALMTGDPVALMVFEWSGVAQQDIILDWTLLLDGATLTRAAQTIAASTRTTDSQSTALGAALQFADAQFARAPACLFQTLDLSGDGIQNEGPEPATVYASGALAGVTVNALPILGASRSLTYDIWLMDHYRDDVIQGPLAFIEVAETFRTFPAVMARKLLRETQTQIYGDLR